MDNYYCSPVLFDLLCKLETDAVGTCRVNRKEIPKDLKEKKLAKGETFVKFRGKLCMVKWMDKKHVLMISTVHNGEMSSVTTRAGKQVQKPKACVDYNKGMGGVDLADQCVMTYSMARKRLKKYYMKMFRHLIDVTVFNCFILSTKLGSATDQLTFRLNLSNSLFETYGSSSATAAKIGRPPSKPSPARLLGRHFPDFNEGESTKKHPHKRCVVCLAHNRRKETIYRCKDCSVALCVAPCFMEYHTKTNY